MTMFLVVAVGLGWSQDDSEALTPQDGAASGTAQQQDATSQSGQANPPPADQTMTPITGLDEKQSGREARSVFIPGAQVSQAVDTLQGNSGGSAIHGVTRAIGSVSLQRLWHRYDFDLDYLGGVSDYTNRATGAATLQLLDAEQHYSWNTGKIAVRDSFSYLPEGNFGGGSFGGIGTLSGFGAGELGGLSGLGILGPGQLATLGEEPRITNVTVADVTQYLSPRSAVLAIGSYGFVHFTDNVLSLINSHQVVGIASYSYQINRKNQIAVLYGHQSFQFPSLSGSDFKTDVVNVLLGHRIGSKLELVGGGGPQFTHIDNPVFGASDRIAFSGRAFLRYRIQHSELTLKFSQFTTNGSGLVAGATTDVVRFSATHPFSRVWTATADVGYSHNKHLSSNPGLGDTSFDYVYAGGTLRRKFSRTITGFISYQFSNLNANASLCVAGDINCSRLTQREVGLIGLDWHPRPIPLN